MSSSGGKRTTYAKAGQALFGLQNGTPTIAQVVIPSDGIERLVVLAAQINATGIETGGAIQLQYTSQVIAQTIAVDPGGHGVGTFVFAGAIVTADAGSTVSLVQISALTAGSANLAYALGVF